MFTFFPDPTKEDKQTMETNAFLSLAKQLPTGRMSLEFFNAFERYEEVCFYMIFQVTTHFFSSFENCFESLKIGDF